MIPEGNPNIPSIVQKGSPLNKNTSELRRDNSSPILECVCSNATPFEKKHDNSNNNNNNNNNSNTIINNNNNNNDTTSNNNDNELIKQ